MMSLKMQPLRSLNHSDSLATIPAIPQLHRIQPTVSPHVRAKREFNLDSVLAHFWA